MNYKKLGTSDLNVSEVCLGTMTWGYQNSESDAFEQLDYAIEKGVNFIDTAELYAIPPSNETYTLTEQYLGNWIRSRGSREKIILATKVAGPSESMDWIRGGRGLTVENINAAIDDSLTRLNTDYIDLYQLHWPQRKVNTFGKRDFDPDFAEHAHGEEHMLSVLEALKKLIDAGKIREVGLSNETPWGMMKYLQSHREDANLPRMQTTQNPYSLLQREFDNHSSEVCFRENISLLPYSPLAGGILTGKYIDGSASDSSRFSAWGASRNAGLGSITTSDTVKQYVDLAREHSLSPTQMALSYVNNRFFVGSNIFGATTMAQLEECIGSVDVVLSDEVLQGIEAIHCKHPNPAVF